MDLLKKIIISIPFYSEEQFKRDVQTLIDQGYGVNLIEVRFDYWEGDLSDELIKEIIQYLRSNQMKMIFTYKVQREYTQDHISVLQRLIYHKPEYVDLDVNIIASVLTELGQYAIQNDVSLVYSYHNTEYTPSLDTISDLCEFFIQMLPNFSSNAKHILKMVFMATKQEDLLVINEFCKRYADQGFNLISFCMGELGKPSRIQSIINGCPFTYAHIGNPTAPGQFHITEIDKYSLNNPLS